MNIAITPELVKETNLYLNNTNSITLEDSDTLAIVYFRLCVNSHIPSAMHEKALELIYLYKGMTAA